MLEFRILGPLEAADGGRPIMLRQKQRALLAVLLLRAGEVVSTDRLIDELWGPSPPRTVEAALHNAVSRLRKALGPDVVVTRPPGYALAVDPEQVDLHRFSRLLGEAHAAADAAERAERLREALALWRGPPLADLAFEPFAAAEAARLDELRLATREELIDAELALSRHAAVLSELEALIAEQPFRERPRALLMVALYRSARQAEALEAYGAARRFLRDELGLDPSPALQQLQAAMLRQDPALDAPDAAPVLGAAEERRKTVTVVFADVVDSTALAAELDPEAYRAVLRRWYRAARGVLEAHGAAVERFVGDAVVGVFGLPQQHEDDAARAVRAAAELRERLVELNAELADAHDVTIAMRAGVNTGAAIAGDAAAGQSFATGYAVNVAALLQRAAPSGGILLGPATYRLVRDAVMAEPARRVELGGRAAPLPAYSLAAVDDTAPGLARRLEAPLVGRDEELATLRRAYDEACADRACRLVTVVGDAGVGKSRLAAELARAVERDATVLVGRCVSYGRGATYLPLAEILRQVVPDGSEAGLAAQVGDVPDARAVARGLRRLLGWAEEAPAPGEGVRAVRRLLEALAATRPLLVVLEDVHWAEPTLLDLVERLANRASGPILVLCLARPELRDARPRWPVLLTLAGLRGEASECLVANLPGAAGVPQAVRARVVAAAEGNALFAEQLLAHVVEDGAEVLDRVPGSIEALLASRLDRLPEDERGVLERAAVVGREFWTRAVAALSDGNVGGPLAALAATGLVRPSTSTLPGEETCSFHHVLIRDVAYAGITKERRSSLHERVADWLAERDPGSDEIIGYHLEQAHGLRAEVAPHDEELARLGDAAGARLFDAGMRALRRGDAPATVNLLERAARLLPDGDRRADAICDLAVAQRMAGQGDRVAGTLADAAAAARAARSRRVELRAAVELAHAGMYGVGELDASPDEVLDAAAAALPVLEEVDDRRGLGRTWLAVSDAHNFRLHFAHSGEAARSALACYRDAGFSPSVCVGMIASAAYWGDEPVRAALRRCRTLLEEVGDDGLARASLAMVTGGLEGMRGRFEIATESFELARRTFEEYGQTLALSASWSGFRARLADLADDQATREAILRASCAGLTAIRQHADLATHAAELADTVEARGEVEEAEELLAVAERHAVEGDVYSDALCCSVRAKLLARRGLFEEARAFAERAVELLESSDAPNLQARARLVAAGVRTLAGDPPDDVAPLIRAAAQLYRRKGNTVMADRASAQLAAFAPS